MKFDFSVFVCSKIVVDLVGEINHLLTDLYTNKHVVVVKNLREEFSSTHTNFNECNFFIVFFNIFEKSLVQLSLFSKKFTHGTLFFSVRVNSVAPYER